MIEQDPKRNFNATEIQSKLESILCTDLSVHIESIRNYFMYKRPRNISDTADREEEVNK